MPLAVPSFAPSWLADWLRWERRSRICRIGDGLTLTAVFSVPLYGVNVAGAPVADLLFGLVILVRGVQFLTEGLPLFELRRHAFLLTIFAVFAVAGAISGFAVGIPLPWEFNRIIVATVGSVLLVMAYGTTERTLVPLLRAFALGCSVLAVSGFLAEQTLGRSTGFSIHPNLLAHSCVMGCFSALYLLRSAVHRGERAMWLVAALVNAGCVLLAAGSRGALLGLWFGLALYFILGGNRRAKLLAGGATYLAVLLLASGVVTLPEGNPISRFNSQSETGAQASADREAALEADIAEISESPVFGTGFVQIIRVHVVYLQGWVGGGALCGFALMVLGGVLLVLPFGQSRRHLALACGGAGVAVVWMFTSVLTTRDQWIFLAIVLRLCDPLSIARLPTSLGLGLPAETGLATRAPTVREATEPTRPRSSA